MAEFVWGTDYRQYLQNQAYVNDIRDAQRTAARETVAAIGAGSLSILLGVEAGIVEMAGAQREGAQLAADAQRDAAQLIASAQWDGARMTSAATEHVADRIVGTLDNLDSTFRWGFGQLVGALGGMSTSLDVLVKSAKTPAQTAAYEQFEIARDAFRKGLYAECLEALGNAISGDSTSPGYKLEWRFHHLVGLIRLGFPGCDVSLVDPAAAEHSFLLAWRYARADEPRDAARALFSAGWAAFVQNKLPEALQHTEGAIEIDAKFTEALFQAAKVRMAQGDPDAALPALRRAITLDHGYALRAASDDVFRLHSQSVDAFLDALRYEKARILQPVAQARLAELTPLIAKSVELAGHRAVSRLRMVGVSPLGMGLMDLLGFEKSLEKDADELSALIFLLARTHRRELRDVSEDREVEEAYEVEEPCNLQETYRENVIHPAGLFRKERVETVERTRTVTKLRTVRKTQTVRRSIKEKRSVWVNEFGDVFSGNWDGWVCVAPGTFKMGGCTGAILPQTPRDVAVTRPFLMQVTPVTLVQWESVMGNPSMSTMRGDHPVTNVSWLDAIAYCNTISRNEGLEEAYVINGGSSVRWKGLDALGYRLPTEAEWEYACRAGTTCDRYGDLDEIAWYAGNSGNTTHRVGEKLPNAWGFSDMLGNIFEWCWDWYDDANPQCDAIDPMGPTTPVVNRSSVTLGRVTRGGAYGFEAKYVQAGQRFNGVPGDRHPHQGLRPVRSWPYPLVHKSI